MSKTAFVLAGGGSLGAVQVGMLKVLLEHGVQADLVVGASVGAINAAYMAADPTLQGVDRLAQIWRKLDRNQIFPIASLRNLLGLFGRRDYLVEPTALRELLVGNLPYHRLEDARIPCHIVATDVLEGVEVCISRGAVVEALLASAAIPGIFPPVELNGRFLMDGGVANNTPVSVAANCAATRLIVLPTGYSCSIDKPPQGVIGMALHALNVMIARQLVVDVMRLSEKVEILTVPPLCPLSISTYDFSKSAELIDRAAARTTRWLREDGLHRHGVPHELPVHSHRGKAIG